VNLQSLSEVGRSLVDIHGQHEHQSLLSVDKHRDFLDAFGKLQADRGRVESLYEEVEMLKKETTDLRQKIKERAQRIDLLKFQIQEIDASALKPGEKDVLTEKRKILSNVNRLLELAETAYGMLYNSEGSCIEKLSSILLKIKEMGSIDHSVSDVLNILESALPLLEDVSVALRGYRDRYDIEPDELSDIEDRLELIKKLEKKYGEGIDEIIGYRSLAEQELSGLELIDERLEILAEELKQKEEMLRRTALALSEGRKKAARTMEQLVKDEMKGLAFSNAEFLIDIREVPVSPCGIDRVEFLFSANQGEVPKPLAKIASGGELSRVMLALKSIFADFDRIPVLIFDEVDAGIGGKTAERVGRKLKAISRKHQVICATHLPQIASMGDFHLKIEKTQRTGRVCVEVKELSEQERLQEIARMLSGKITEVSLQHARELIGSTV
jgi:DNA repair protein RecN (Recombination protein N)